MLPDLVTHLAAGNRVSVAHLIRFDFLSQTMRFWDGLGWLTAAGERWQGSGKVISISGMEQSAGMSAPQATFTLTGANDELIEYAANSDTEVVGQPCSVYAQFLSAPFTPIGDPIALWAGNMDVMSFRAGFRQQSISLTAETLWVSRTRAPYGYMTDTDQQARWPGDFGMEFMASLVNKTVSWLRG